MIDIIKLEVYKRQGEPCALAAAARDYGFSISRARRIEDEALRHIRENLAAQGREKAAA